nr:kelch repeat-containing protein [bacterium]
MHRVEGPKPQITDGVNWIERTSAAPWQPRAGLSAVVLNEYIYVLGGSQNDDASIIGPNGPARQYYNDVWRSPDGVEWELMTETASWEPRAG